jgi:hypothetical protein
LVQNKIEYQGEIHMEVKKDQTNSSVAKPTLLSTPRLATAASGGGDGHDGEARILFNLGAEPLAKKKLGTSSTRPGLKFFSLLGLSATAAFVGYQYLPGDAVTGTPAGALNHTSAAPPVATAAATPVLAAATPVPLPVAPVAPPLAAKIVNESTATTAAPAAPSRAANDSKLTTALEEGVAPPTAAIQKALEDKAPVKVSAEPKTANAQPVTKRKPAPVSPLAAPVHAAKAKAKVKPITPVDDEDVNLIAALIAHGDASTRLARAEAEQPVAAKTSDATAPEKKKKKKKAHVSATSSQ